MENTNEQVPAEQTTELFLGLDKTQLGVVLVTAKTAQELGTLVKSDTMASAFEKLRNEYKGKTAEEQVEYVQGLKTLCQSSITSALFALNLIDQVERNLMTAMLAQRNVESVSK